MKNILPIAAWTCFSLSCYSMGAGDKFLKILDNEYVQYHYEPSANSSKVSVGHITPTRVKTYGETEPDNMWNIQAINYTTNGACLFKDCDNNCCIDIYESINNPNKCRIVGTDGRNVHIGSLCFSVYAVSTKEKSFVNNKPRTIFLDNSGVYIVSTQKNPLNSVIEIYEREKKFKFKEPVIRVSAIYGNRTINGRLITSSDFVDRDSSSDFSKSKKSTASKNSTAAQNSTATKNSAMTPNAKSDGVFVLNCSYRTPLFIGANFGPVTKLYPAMQQIELITNVKLTSPPPSKKSVVKRISDILGLGVIADMLAIKDGKVYLADVTPAAIKGEIPNVVWSLADAALLYSYAYPLKNFIPLINQDIQWSDYTQACLNIDLLVRNGILREYMFDTSAWAAENRRQIASLAWDEI